MRPAWWMCNGWWSPWCVLDVLCRGHLPKWAHERHLNYQRAAFDRDLAAGEPVEVQVSPNLRVIRTSGCRVNNATTGNTASTITYRMEYR